MEGRAAREPIATRSHRKHRTGREARAIIEPFLSDILSLRGALGSLQAIECLSSIDPSGRSGSCFEDRSEGAN
jgi:hypothetical protein